MVSSAVDLGSSAGHSPTHSGTMDSVGANHAMQAIRPETLPFASLDSVEGREGTVRDKGVSTLAHHILAPMLTRHFASQANSKSPPTSALLALPRTCLTRR